VNSKQGTAGSGLSKVEVMNAKITSVSSKVTETAKVFQISTFSVKIIAWFYKPTVTE
jgi:hypothetical protein